MHLEGSIFFRKKPNDFVILVVCTANITRSPYIAALLRKTLVESGLRFRRRIVVKSAGTNATANQQALPTIATIAYTRGIDLQEHRSSLLTGELINEASLILTAEMQHKESILKRFPEAYDRVYQITEYGRLGNDPKIRDVIDPTGRDLEEFQEFVGIAHEEVKRVLEHMVRIGAIE
ncbi:hypothetical protein KQI52_08895 [bacterium]|nr:hypothetical protein [bacterium]